MGMKRLAQGEAKCWLCFKTETIFPMTPKTKGYGFGTICAECDDKQEEGKT